MRSLHTGVGERRGTAGGMRVAFVVGDGRFNGSGRGGDGGYDTAWGAECGAAGERERKRGGEGWREMKREIERKRTAEERLT